MTRTPLSKSKGQGHQAALLSAALTREAAAAVSVGRRIRRGKVLGGARDGGGEGRGRIVSPRAPLVFLLLTCHGVFLID